MRALFPTFTNFWQRAKRILANDITEIVDIWQSATDEDTCLATFYY
jgi:hypothetical protein